MLTRYLFILIAVAVAPAVLGSAPGSGIPEATAPEATAPETRKSTPPVRPRIRPSMRPRIRPSMRHRNRHRTRYRLFKGARFQGTKTKFIDKIKGAAKNGIQNAITKKSHDNGLVWKFYPEEKKYKDKVDEMKVKVAKRTAYNNAKKEQWRVHDLNPPAPFDPHTWGDKVSCTGCYIVLERAWSQASPEKPAEEGAAGAPSLLEVKGEKEVTADDIYQAMMDVCGEQISLFDETCKTLEENSRAVADSLILNHGEVKQVCDTVGLCWDGLLTTYKSWEVAHPPSVRRL